MSSSSSSSLPPKEHAFKYAQDQFIPPCLFARYGDPFLTLTHFFDGITSTAIVPEQQYDDLQKVVSANKKNSIKRTAPKPTAITRSVRLSDCVAEVSKRLSARVDAFVAFVVRITHLRHERQIIDLTNAAAYVLLDRTVTQHSELKRLKLCDNSIVHAIGICETKKQILADSLADGCGMKRANERCNEVIQFVSRWLLEACDNNVAAVASMLPVIWQWDSETLEPLSEKELENNYLRCRLDLPFLIIGLLDILQLNVERNRLILDVYQTFV